MRILIFSDTHRFIDGCIEVIQAIDRVDAVLHAGDHVSDAEDLAACFPAIPMHYVRGNNDLYSKAPAELTVSLGGKKIFMTHGHQHGVKYSTRQLRELAQKNTYDMIVFGHTHEAYTEYCGKTILLNPGSMGYGRRTYAVAEIENGILKTALLTY